MVPLERNMFLSVYFIVDNLTVSILLVLAFIFLIIISAFFSYVETIFSSVNIIRLRNYLEEKKKGSRKAVYISEKYDYTLTTILICNAFVRVLATLILWYLLNNIIDNDIISIITMIISMTTIVLLFGEIIPKAKGQNNPEKQSLKYSTLLFIVIKITWPITSLYVRFKRCILRKNELGDLPKVTNEELGSIIDVMETEGVFEEDDAEMIQNAISLSELTVYDIMTPRVDMVAMDVESSIDDFKEMFFEYQFSRIPVYKEDKDNILGILSEKDFFTAILKNKEVVVEDIMSEPYYVSKSMKVNELIQDMRKVKKHFAVVVDEYGGTNGIVTMEDALEEIVGEIYDEYDDVDDEDIIKITENKYLIDREMYLEDLFDVLELGDTPDTSFSSVGGFVYSLCDGLPIEGNIVNYKYYREEYIDGEEVLTNYDLEFTIKKVENRRIKLIELLIKKTIIEK